MKSRSVKLKEAHKASATPVHCSILWGMDGSHIVTASASEPSVSIHDPSQPSKPHRTVRHHRDGVTAIALSPDSASLASASIDHSVKLYSFPDGEFQSNVTRFTLPIRSLAFNKSGSLLASGGDDDGIKLIATVDSSISRVLKGHKGPVTGLSFDPMNEFLASIDGFGTVIYWELSSGKAVHTLRAIAPNCDSDISLVNVLGWSPDGEILAVAGLRNDVIMYDRDTAEKMYTLKGDHERPVCYLAWSPNGKYLATSALDKQILIWNLDQRQDIERQKFDDRISCLAWKPNGNALAAIDCMGKFGVWDSPVPSCMTSPTEGAQTRNTNGLHIFSDDGPKASGSGNLDDFLQESNGESTPVSRKRIRKQSVFEDSINEDSDGQEGLLRQIESRKRSSVKREIARQHTKEECVISIKSARLRMQECFQPGSTPVLSGKRRFLCYNMLGSITSIENDGYSHIEVDFHDTGRGPRVPSMTDYFGFTMASLNENGSVFANPRKGEKNMSTLMYRPFSSWANNSEWSMRFEAEEVKAVALGTGWVAAVTSLNFLRIFTEGGLQKHILSLTGPVVTAVGYKDELAIVSHASDCLSSGDQVLEVKVLNIVHGAQQIGCRLSLTPDSALTWFGFSEEGQLCSFDSKGVLRVFCNQFGGSWLPLFSASKARKSEDEIYWIVGLNASKLFCVVCKAPDLYPPVTPKPVLVLLYLSFPLACSDLGADDLENELLMDNLHLSQTQKKIEESAASGLDVTALDDEAFSIETTIDRCILRLIASCCNGDKLVRATELARLLYLEKSVKGAIKLVSALKLPILAERFSAILVERLSESEGVVTVQTTASNSTNASNGSSLKKLLASAESANALVSPVLPHPHFSKQQIFEGKAHLAGIVEPSKDTGRGTVKPGLNQGRLNFSNNSCAKPSSDLVNSDMTAKGEACMEPCKNASKENSKEASIMPLKRTSGGNIMETPGKSAKESSGEGGNQGQFHRPGNPFAKPSKNEQKSSLLDSIKKTKKGQEKDERVSNKNSRA